MSAGERSIFTNLAKSKESQQVWVTRYWPVDWTNQTLIRPISRSALKARASSHLEQLAKPKKNFQLDHPELCCRDEFEYSCGRGSVICEVSPAAVKTEPSEKILQLAQPTNPIHKHNEDS